MAQREKRGRRGGTRSGSKRQKLHEPSDPKLDDWCDFCFYESDKKIAPNALCNECNSFLCKRCIISHEQSQVLRSHNLLTDERMPNSQSEKPFKYFDCNTHIGLENDHFCIDHSKMLCSQCVREYHSRCKTNFIPVLSKDLGPMQVCDFKDVIADVKQNFVAAKSTLEINISDIEEYRAEMVREADKRRDEMIEVINKLHFETVEKINDVCDCKRSYIADKISVLSEMIRSLDENISAVENREEMYIGPSVFVKLQDIVFDTRKFVRRLNKQFKKTTFTFSAAPEIATFTSTCKLLGDVKEVLTDIQAPKQIADVGFPQSPDLAVVAGRKRKREDISNIQPAKMTPLSARSPEDKTACEIAGIAVTEAGSLLILDNNNRKIKMLSSDNQILSTLSLPVSAKFRLVTVINDKKAVVYTVEKEGTNYYRDKELHFLDISDETSISLEKSVNYVCMIAGLAACDNNLVISWWSPYNSVQMVDVNDKEVWGVGGSSCQYTNRLFGVPLQLARQKNNNRQAIVVFDMGYGGASSLFSVDAGDGSLIKKIDVKDHVKGQGLISLTADEDGNVYALMWQTKEIHVWSVDLSESRILLPSEELDSNPTSMVYNGLTDEIFVSYQNCNRIDRFQL